MPFGMHGRKQRYIPHTLVTVKVTGIRERILRCAQNDKRMRLPRLHGFAVNGLAMTERLAYLPDVESFTDVLIDNAAEVIAVDSQFHCHGERPGTLKGRGEEETPVVPLTLFPYS